MGRAAVLVVLAVAALGACGRLRYDRSTDAEVMVDTGPPPADSGPPPLDATADAPPPDVPAPPDASCIGAPETCNGIDDDCNAIVDDGDLCGAPSVCADAHCVESRAFAVPIGGGGVDLGEAVAVDQHGTMYVAATFEGTVEVGTATLMGHGGGDVLLASFRQDGSFRWAISFGGAMIDSPLAVAAGPDQVAVAGIFQGAVDFGGRVVVAPGGISGFIAAFAQSDGSLRWVHAFGNGAASLATDVAVTPDGFAVAGTFSESADLGDMLVRTATGEVEGFVARYAGDGRLRWAHTFPSMMESDARAVAVDPLAGMVFVSGVFTPDVDLGGGRILGTGLEGFVGSFALTDGRYRWGRTLVGSGAHQAFDLAPRADGRLQVAGRFTGDLGTDVSPTAARSAGGSDGFAASLTAATGGIVEVRAFGGATEDTATSIALRPGPGAVSFTGGFFTGTAALGSRTADSFGRQDAYVSQLGGDFVGMTDLTFGGPGDDNVTGVVVDTNNGAVIICGSFQGDVAIPTVGLLHSSGDSDTFLARFPMLP